jgi:hypothetical protein
MYVCMYEEISQIVGSSLMPQMYVCMYVCRDQSGRRGQLNACDVCMYVCMYVEISQIVGGSLMPHEKLAFGVEFCCNEAGEHVISKVCSTIFLSIYVYKCLYIYTHTHT